LRNELQSHLNGVSLRGRCAQTEIEVQK